MEFVQKGPKQLKIVKCTMLIMIIVMFVKKVIYFQMKDLSVLLLYKIVYNILVLIKIQPQNVQNVKINFI